jgi:hypothetical protein
MEIVPARNGWLWLVKGFALFRKSPVTWLFLVLTYWMAMALLGEIRYLGVALSTVLLPAFSVSFMIVCAVLDRGAMLRPALLASGFRSRLGTLLLLGALYLLSIGAALAIASVADAGALLQWVIVGQEPPAAAIRDGSVSRAFMLAAAAGTPILMAFWFAPVLVAWDRMGAGKSLFYSFFSVLRNWRAFLTYAGAFVLGGTAFLLLSAVVVVITGGQAGAMRFFGLAFTLLTLPTIFGSFYASYRDIFPGSPVPQAPTST